MRKYGVALAGLALAGLMAVPAAAASPTTNDGVDGAANRVCARQFDQTVKRFDDAFLAKRLDEFMANYHKDATTVSTSGDVTTSKAEIRDNFAGLFELDFVANFHPIRQAVEDCKTAVIVSDFVLDIPSLNFHAHFVNSLSWTREHGRWQVLIDQNTPIL
ncbi:MAG: YybH family protein [Labedaea sp.]